MYSVRLHATDEVQGTCFHTRFSPPRANAIKDNSSCPHTSATTLQLNAIGMSECPYRHWNILYVLYRWVNYFAFHTTCDTNLGDMRCGLFPFTNAAATSNNYLSSYAQDEQRNANPSSKFTDRDTN